MAYIGKKPTAAPLTSSDIADSIITEAKMADDAISLTELKAGTDGELITWDASGNPAAVAAGTSGHFLKSQGAGSVPVFAAASGGKILQVVGTSTTDTDSTTSTSWTDFGMSQAITPTTTGSKILVCVSVDINAGGFGVVKVVRDIASGGYGDITGMRGDARGSNRKRTLFGGNNVSLGGSACTFLDSPSYSAGNAITYKVQWMTESSITVYRNRRGSGDSDAVYHHTNASILTLMEVGS